MNYEEALEYIHGVNWTFCKPGLERIGELCEKLGHPERKLRFVHVAGTNGKGSFCSMLDSVLREAGYKVGLYTSPYIYQFNERMRFDGKNIPNETLAEITDCVRPIADSMEDKPTEFELITAIAFEYFKRQECDVVVLEAGLGGRLDSTNIITTPILSVITGIALDHTAILGDTVEKIAKEKSGIIKPSIPVLFGGEDETARAVISETAKKCASDYYEADYSLLKINDASLKGSVFDYKDLQNVKINLLGLYQPMNASLVIEAAKILDRHGLRIRESALRAGLSKAGWRARFEIIRQNPTVIFDGAHNPQGINVATDSIKHYYKDKKVVTLSGVLKDKDYRAIAKKLSEVSDRAFTITPDNSRALGAKEFAEVLSEYGVTATPCKSIEEALRLGICEAERRDTALTILGSLYTYADIVKAMDKKTGIN